MDDEFVGVIKMNWELVLKRKDPYSLKNYLNLEENHISMLEEAVEEKNWEKTLRQTEGLRLIHDKIIPIADEIQQKLDIESDIESWRKKHGDKFI